MAESKPKVGVETRTPDEWARIKGHVVELTDATGAPMAGKEPNVGWQHRAAETLHRWQVHAHHAGKPILLTESDYDAALAAASAAEGNPVPHEHALGKY